MSNGTNGESRYLVVNDRKNDRDPGPRLGVLTVAADSAYTYTAVQVADWIHPDGEPSDLEGACPVPDDPGCFLLAESGYFRSKFGRVFSVRVRAEAGGFIGEVERVYELPRLAGKEPYNLEGIVCFRWQERLHVLLADRGQYSMQHGGDGAGTLFCALLPRPKKDERILELQWERIHRLFRAPPAEVWHYRINRHFSDLLLQLPPPGTAERPRLWAAATYDPDLDAGPFASIVYELGTLDLSASDVDGLIEDRETPSTAEWVCSGVKVEGLAVCPQDPEQFCYGTDDEAFVGIWRRLPERDEKPRK